MSKIKNKTIMLLIALALILCGLSAFMGVNPLQSAFADESETYFAVEDYTDSDWLLKRNGQSSSSTIQEFAKTVRYASENTAFPELAEVIPPQYLESTEKNAVFSYNGKEYGFYVVKDNYRIDVLLIDFVYEFDNGHESDIEYKIQIKPILQQSFVRGAQTNNGYEWKTCANENTYYVANPRFLALVQNENALNYGDVGYSKNYDEGVIITQSRLNYGKISYPTASTIAEFVGKQILTAVVDAALDYYTGGVASVIKTIYNTAENFYNENKEITIEANNETNIFTQQSKTAQKNNMTLSAYSRTAGFVPSEEMILSAADDSYAEFITVLNDANYRTRLTQICDFDIVKKSSAFDSMHQVEGPEGDKAFSFHNEKILFENQAPLFNLSSDNFEKELMPVYLLPHGEEVINFSPMYSGTYTFGGVESSFSVKDSNNESIDYSVRDDRFCVFLKGDKNYSIVLKNNSNLKIITNLDCRVQEIKEQSTDISGTDNCIVGYSPQADTTLRFYTDDKNCKISILNSKLQTIKQSSNYSCYFNFENTERYYILVQRTETANFSTKIHVEEPIIYDVGEMQEIELNNEEMFVGYKLNSDNYIFEYSFDSANFSGCTKNVIILESVDTNLKVNYALINSTKGQTVYFGFCGSGKINFKIQTIGMDYIWEVNGKTDPTQFTSSDSVRLVSANKMLIQRGLEATVKLKVGPMYIPMLAKTSSYNGYSYNANNKLIIANNCQLTNDSQSNLLGLMSAYEQFQIAKLDIQVVSDIKTISATRFTNNSDYGLNIRKLSNVAEETVEITLLITPAQYEYQITINALGGMVGLRELIEKKNIHDSIDNFNVFFKKVVIYSQGGATTVYNSEKIDNQMNGSRSYSLNRYFDEKSGDAFYISCQRHLENVKGHTSESYILDSDLTLTNWVPISEFNGRFNFNYKRITFINKSIAPNGNYGFIDKNYGTLEYGRFLPNMKVISNGSDAIIKVGVVCAENYGLINNFFIYDDAGSIYVKHWRTYFGTIAGANYGTIKTCYNLCAIRGDSFNFGGLVGINSGKSGNYLFALTNHGKIYAENNGTMSICVGGIVGLATEGSKIEQGYNTGDILYDYKNTNYRVTLYMGGIAGRMCKADELKDPYSSGTVSVQTGVYPDTVYKTDAFVGMYFDPENTGSGGGCVASGTLITLNDGRQVPVEQLNGDEILLVWNLQTGTFDAAPILFIDSDPADIYEVTNLYFSDGTEVKVIYEHAFWDFNLNQYVFLRNDAAQYIGHWFNKQTTDENGQLVWTRVQLVNVIVKDEYTTSWSPVTYSHLCYYVNGMLSMPGATEGLINIFEVDAESMKFDATAMERDIEQYGLFTYEEFAQILPVPQEVFDAFNAQYFKVAIGKGLITEEKLAALVERYAGQLGIE